MMSTYYRQEKSAFWVIQILMGLAVLFSLIWVLGLIAGLNYLSDPTYLEQYKVSFLNDFFKMPLAVWILLLSLAGIAGAAISFLSFHVGVRSVIRFQMNTIKDIFSTIQDNKNHQWIQVVKDEPLAKTNQIIKMSVQMTGLVVRRISRMLVPLITFIISFIALLKLDAYLLSFMIPLAIVYVIALYFINRYAARNQVILSGLSKRTMRSLSDVIKGVLNRTVSHHEAATEKLLDSGYQTFSDYRYKRRLAEIHVTWLNTLFLVLGCAVIILSVDFTDKTSFDWMHLLYFIVALRYAGSGLQQMASATVSFSRFLPEVELVYALLSGEETKFHDNKKTTDEYTGCVFFLSTQFSECLIAEAIIKQSYSQNNVVLLDDFIQREDQPEQNVWIYSDRPTLFKQKVRKHSNEINWVLVEINGNLKAYNNIQEFLEEFDPDNFQKIKTQSVMLDDEDM